MKNNKFKTFLLIICISLIYIQKPLSENFITNEFFEYKSDKIEIENNLVTGLENIEIFLSSKNIFIKGKKFQYDLEKKFLRISGDAHYINKTNNIEINANNIEYDIMSEKIYFNKNIFLKSQNKFDIKNEVKITYDLIKNTIYSNTDTIFYLHNKTIINAKDFNYNITDNFLKSSNLQIEDVQGNTLSLSDTRLDLNNKLFFGQNFELKFFKNIFGNKENDPRMKGKNISITQDILEIKNASFTTCKINKNNEDCPPWIIEAKNVKYLKNKKRIEYSDAILKIYNRPILFLPKFSHPDPSVKRQSGFLAPQFNNSNLIGSSVSMPYYNVINENSDLTFTPRFFSDKAILQTEYRLKNKNSNYTIDASIKNSDEKDKFANHLFYNNIIEINSKKENQTFEINLEYVNRDNYLKKYSIKSPLIKDNNILNSYMSFLYDGNDYMYGVSYEIFEDLSKNKTDRFEFIYPKIEFQKNLNSENNIYGDLIVDSVFYQKNFDTNIFETVLINDLKYSNTNISTKGIISDVDFNFKNINSDGKRSIKYKDKSSSNFLSKLSYKISQPLSKENKKNIYEFTPKLMVNYSPNKNRNINSEYERIDIDNVFLFDRIKSNDTLESGASVVAGLDYDVFALDSEKKFGASFASNFRTEENLDLPKNGSIGEKQSDIFGDIEYKLNKNFDFKYKFSLNNNLKKSNYDNFQTDFKFNNYTHSLEYINEKQNVIGNRFVQNRSSLILNANNKINFNTRRNIDRSLTEYYDLVYEYQNDCLIAGLQFKKENYYGLDIEPNKEIFFSLTLLPFGGSGINSN